LLRIHRHVELKRLADLEPTVNTGLRLVIGS
jgi:hypothetical protein